MKSILTITGLMIGVIFFFLTAGIETVEAKEQATDPSLTMDQQATQNYPVFSDDQVITGVKNRMDSYFEIGKNKKTGTGSYLDLTFSHSPILVEDASFLTILMDDVPISSVPLDETNVEKTTIKVDLSHLSLEPGFHKLSFQIQMNATRLVCENPDSPANWMVIYGDSRLHFKVVDVADQFDLSMYPMPFYEIGGIPEFNTVVVVPDEPVQAELVAAAQLLQFFSKQNYTKRLSFNVYTEKEVTQQMLSDRHVVWIGMKGRFDGLGKTVIEAFEKELLPANDGAGFIAIGYPSWGENTHLVLTGEETELANGAKILSEKALFSQLRGAYSMLSTEPIEQDLEREIQTGKPVSVTFSQMGYADMVMENALTGNIKINYTLPDNWDFSDEARLRLIYTHSTSVNLRESIMAIKVNGKPVESQYFQQSEKGDGVLDIDLPKELLSEKRSLEIELTIDFITVDNKNNEGIEECSAISLIGHWAVIDAASSLTFTPKRRTEFNLQSLPYPFVVNGRWNDTTVVIGDEVDGKVLSSLLTVIGMMGRDAYDSTQLSFVQLSVVESKEELRGQNIIYIGASDHLPAKWNDFGQSMAKFVGGAVISRIENMEILKELQQGSVVIQLSPSPDREENSILHLVTTEKGQVDMISHAFTDARQYPEITGGLAIVDQDDKVHRFSLPQEKKLADTADETQQEQFPFGIVLFMVPLVGLLVVLGILMRKMLKN